MHGFGDESGAKSPDGIRREPAGGGYPHAASFEIQRPLLLEKR